MNWTMLKDNVLKIVNGFGIAALILTLTLTLTLIVDDTLVSSFLLLLLFS